MSNEWYTPSKYIEAARSVMGSIDLDPASCALANETVQATTYYTKEQDGLALPWYGNVWLNPPYGNITPWANKFIQVYQTSQIQQGIALLQPWPETRWGQAILQYPICFIAGRINFAMSEGYLPGKSRYGSMIVYLGFNEDVFIDTFSQFGIITRAVRTGVVV